jgi:hypothetical protein
MFHRPRCFIAQVRAASILTAAPANFVNVQVWSKVSFSIPTAAQNLNPKS